jgi:hypothetical protein
LHIFCFCSYVFGCLKWATTRITHLRSLIAILTKSSRMQFPMLEFRQTIDIARKYWDKNEQGDGLFIYLLDQGAISPSEES